MVVLRKALWPGNGGCPVRFKTPQRAAVAGQFCVLYDGPRCLGGGEIASTETMFGERDDVAQPRASSE